MFSRSADCGVTWSPPRVISRVPSADVNDDGVANTADVTRLQASLGRSCGQTQLQPQRRHQQRLHRQRARSEFRRARRRPARARASRGFRRARRSPSIRRPARCRSPGGSSTTACCPTRSSPFARPTAARRSRRPRSSRTLNPFDQGTTTPRSAPTRFPTMAFDGAGRAYLAWSSRGYAAQRPDPVDWRCAHRHVDVDQRHDLVDAGGRRQRWRTPDIRSCRRSPSRRASCSSSTTTSARTSRSCSASSSTSCRS